MGTSSTTTSTRTLPGAQAQETDMRGLMAQLAKTGVTELGDLSKLAQGTLTLSPEDEALIRRIQELTMNQARDQMRGNYEFTANMVEGQTLDRGIGGSTMEAVNQALLGREMQTGLNNVASQGQITSAEQLQKSAEVKANTALNANQLLLQKILGGAQSTAEMALTERLNQGTTTETTKSPFNAGQALALGTRAAGALFSGGTSEVARAATQVGGQNAADYMDPDLGTGRSPWDYKGWGT